MKDDGSHCDLETTKKDRPKHRPRITDQMQLHETLV